MTEQYELILSKSCLVTMITQKSLFKGHQMQNSLYKLFEHKCVLKVCVHIHPLMIKIHPVFFFKSLF